MKLISTCRLSGLLAFVFAGATQVVMAEPAAPAAFKIPDEASIPAGPAGDAIKLGKTLITDTHKLLPANVGNGLNCSNCHLAAGTTPGAAPYVGLWGVFPEFRARGGRINSLQERVNDCFERSMNGKALTFDSKEMNAILMYMQWLSKGVPTGTEVAGRGMGKVDTKLIPDPAHGKAIYAEKCASCHAADGAGTKNPAGGYLFPPVWGEASYNIGAGLARTYTAAGFIKHNMPLGQGGTLSDQDAVDVAEFMTHQSRPAFAGAKNDYAAGNKPKDARN
jgi:thiosulfate dehydrogenase